MTRKGSVAIVCLILLLRSRILNSQNCSGSIRNASLICLVKSEPIHYGFEIIVNDCISESIFKDDSPAEIQILCHNKEITKLEKNAVKELSALERLYFQDCPISSIEAGSLEALPKLARLNFYNVTLTEITRGVFGSLPSIYTLRIALSKVSKIAEGAFGNLPSLQYVTITTAQLDHWLPEWFINSTNLISINFAENFIRRIPPKAFASFKNITYINFSRNEISIIDPKAFEGITTLNHLILQCNRLTTISGDIFPSPIKMRFIDLSANYLNYLSKDFMKKITLNVINLEGNPITCPCMEEIKSWLDYRDSNGRRDDLWVSLTECAPVPPTLSCVEVADKTITERYLNNLTTFKAAPFCYCVRLDS